MKDPCVFRSKKVDRKRPKLGLPEDVQPGDWLTFFDQGRFVTREVASAHKGYVLTAPLVCEGTTLDGPHKVKFDSFYEALRPHCEEKPPAKEEAAAVPEPELTSKIADTKKPKKPTTSQPPKRKKKRKKKPPPEWLDFLATEYRDDD